MYILPRVFNYLLTVVRVEIRCLCGRVLTVTHGAGMDTASASSLQLVHCRTWLNLVAPLGNLFKERIKHCLAEGCETKCERSRPAGTKTWQEGIGGAVTRAQIPLQWVVETVVGHFVPHSGFWRIAVAAWEHVLKEYQPRKWLQEQTPGRRAELDHWNSLRNGKKGNAYNKI